jgi:hypothetical protein
MGLKASKVRLRQVRGSSKDNKGSKDSSQRRELPRALALKVIQGQQPALVKVQAPRLDCQTVTRAMAAGKAGQGPQARLRTATLAAKVALEVADLLF